MAKRPKIPGSNQGGGGVMQQIQQLQEQMIKAQEAFLESKNPLRQPFFFLHPEKP